MSELLRRHGTRLGLRVYESHPGGGTYDGLALFTETGNERKQLAFFHTLSQRLDIVDARGSVQDANVPGWPGGDQYVLAFVSSADPKTVVDDAERALGFPSSGTIPPSTPAITCTRAIAAFLRARALERETYDVRSGWALDEPREWIAVAPAVRDAVASAAPGTSKAVRAASRLWRVAQASAEHGVVLDLGSGEAISTRTGHRESIWELYQRTRSLPPIVSWIATELHG